MKPLGADVGVTALEAMADPGLSTGHGHISAGCPASGQEQMTGTPSMPHLLREPETGKARLLLLMNHSISQS